MAKPGALIAETRERLAAYAALPVIWLGCAGSMVSLPPFEHGFRAQSEPILFTAFAAAGLAALVLAGWIAAGGRPSRPALLVALPAFLLALWLMVSGPQGFAFVHWRLRLLGDPSFGLGALWYAAIGLWVLLGDLVLRQPQARQLALLGAIAVSLPMLGAYVVEYITGTSSGLLVRAFYTWPALFLPIWAAALYKDDGRQGRWLLMAAIAVSLLLLAMSRTATLVGAAAVGAAVALAWPRLRAPPLTWLRHPVMVWALVAAAALLPLLLISLPALTANQPSLESRRLTWMVVRGALEHEPAMWLRGLGAGSMSGTLAAETLAAGFPVWRLQEWDFLSRDYSNAHNWLLQVLHDGGLPALLLLAWLIAMPLRLARPERRGLALALTVAYWLGLGLWFEHTLSLAFIGITWAALVAPSEPERSKQRQEKPESLGKHRPALAAAGIAGLLLLGGTGLWAAVALERMSAMFNPLVAWFDPKLGVSGPVPPTPVDPRRADVVLADFIKAHANSLVWRHQPANGQTLDMAWEAQRSAALLGMIAAQISQTTSVQFALTSERFLSDLMQRQELASYRPPTMEALSLWRRVVEQALMLAPRRNDVALGYLTWTFANRGFDQVRAMARRLQALDANDPIALFFEAGILSQSGSEADRSQAADLLRRAMLHDLERYFPLDDNFKAQFGPERK